MRTQKENRIIALKKEGKTVREIAEITKSSFATITSVVNDAEDEEGVIANDRHRQEEKKLSDEKYKRALEMFAQGKQNVEVATSIGLRAEEVISYRKEYWKLIGADKLVTLYDRIEPNISSIVRMTEMIVQEGICDEEIRRVFRRFKEFRALDDKISQAKAQLNNLYEEILKARNGLQSYDQEKARLEGVIEGLKNKELEYMKNFQSYREFRAYARRLKRLNGEDRLEEAPK